MRALAVLPAASAATAAHRGGSIALLLARASPLAQFGTSAAPLEAAAAGEDAAFYDTTVERFASQPVEMLSLMQMLQFGRNAATQPEKVLKSARYVQREIPKRLARRLLDLQLLPYIVVNNPHIKRVYTHYRRSFDVLRQLPPVHTLEDNATFSQIMRQQLDHHAPMLDALATGLREVKSKQLVGRCLQLDAFFDSMLRSRISRRVIAEQHLQLTEKRPGYIGIISTDLDVADAVDLAAQKTRQVCMETYGTAPEIVLSGDTSARVPYIPAHLDYMLYELLKNAARAVVEQHASAHAAQQHNSALPHAWHPSASSTSTSTSTSSPSHASSQRQQPDHHNSHPQQHQNHHTSQSPPSPQRSAAQHHHHNHHHHHHGSRHGGSLPPIHVRICQGYTAGSDLTIKISDQGGGIPPHLLERVWSYGFTTVGGIPPGYDLPPPAHTSPFTSPSGGPTAAPGFPSASPLPPPPSRHWAGSSAGDYIHYDPHHAHAHHHQHHVHAHHHGQYPGQGGADAAMVMGRAGVFPTAEAAARSTQSHWHIYSPAGVASGPYAPQPLTHTPYPAVGGAGGASGNGAGNATGGGLSLSPDGVYHREGLGSDGMGALMGEVPGAAGAAVGGSAVGAGGGGGGRFRIAGLGFGLPLSRLYARYFGGDLTLQVVPGYGTDAFLTIRRLEDGEWREQMDDHSAMMGQMDG